LYIPITTFDNMSPYSNWFILFK